MVGFTLKNTLSEFGAVARGLCLTTANGVLRQVTELTRIEKDKDAARYTDAAGKVHPLTGAETVSMNIWGFTPALFDQLRQGFSAFLRDHFQEEKSEFYIPGAVNDLVAAGAARVRVLRTPDSWFGVTYREDRPRVVESIRALVRNGSYPEKLWG
jgi:hypothetical protein